MENSLWHRLIKKVWEKTILTFQESSDSVKAMVKKECEEGKHWTISMAGGTY
jgi:hypothetical protein